MKLLMGLMLTLSTTACASLSFDRQGSIEKAEMYGAQVGIVNHTEKYIYSTKVGSGGGGHAEAYSAGIANICCVTLPQKWHPNLKILVQWDMPVGRIRNWKEKTVDVEKYDEPGSVYLHFFPDDQVRVVVTTWVGGAPEHPIPRPVKPAIFTKGN